MIHPPRRGKAVNFHHPLVGWTRGVVERVVHDAQDLEDVPHWGAWIRHGMLGSVWVMGGEVCEDNTYAR